MLSTVATVVLSGPVDGVAPLLAYLDPGSGSMVLQVMIAGLLSGLYYFRSSLTQLRGWFAGLRAGR